MRRSRCCILAVLLLLLSLRTQAWMTGVSPQRRSARPRRPLSLSHARRHFYYDDDDDREQQQQQENDPRRPTLALPAFPVTPTPPAKPKIVVLGATGHVGRRVVRQLLEMEHLDAMTIVAFVRDYDKACRVFFDDLLVASHNQANKKGPKLHIVLGNLVSRSDLPPRSNAFWKKEEENNWRDRAKSASRFFRNAIQNYDNGEYLDEDEEALEEAIRDCTVVVSCVGDVRITNLWTDLIARPLWRLIHWDVRSWCLDPRHPYYVHYSSTRKVLRLAEREQFRRESHAEDEEEKKQIPRIRFIRISDLSVASPPWQVIPVVANALYSMVYRYHALCEQLLERSTLVDTITLRSGDIVDEERDVETTNLQLTTKGKLPMPARIGRDDVAALAVEGALFSSQPNSNEQQQQHRDDLPFHYTLACRWASDRLTPYPSQGQMGDGLPTARQCMQAALRKLRKQRRRKPVAKRKVKPYGICVAVPVYLLLSLTLWRLVQSMSSFGKIPLPVRTGVRKLGLFLASGSWWRKLLDVLGTTTRNKTYISF